MWDYDYYDSYENTHSTKRNEIKLDVKLNKNSDVSKLMSFSYGQMKKWEHVLEKIVEELGLRNVRMENLRIFNRQGLELFEQDLRFVKSGDTIYISGGEDFDIMSYYSEYEIGKQLGAGGFGNVKLGVNKKTGEKVAIKITIAGSIDSAKDIYQVFSESETLKNLKHPNIVTMHNCFMDKKTMQSYFIMEYLEGGELYKYIEEKGKLIEEESLHIFKQLISAVDYCHRNKIIHRDLKLENILRVSEDSDQFKIVDFGIAGLSAGRKSEETHAGSVNYMAPEIHSENSHASPALDVFALGCILNAMVTGKLPFDDKQTRKLIDKIKYEPVTFSDDMVLSEEIKDLITRMLEKDPQDRITIYEIQHHPWFQSKKLPPKKEPLVSQEEIDIILKKKTLIKGNKETYPGKTKVKFQEPKRVPHYMKPKRANNKSKKTPKSSIVSRRKRKPKGVLKKSTKFGPSASPSPRGRIKNHSSSKKRKRVKPRFS